MSTDKFNNPFFFEEVIKVSDKLNAKVLELSQKSGLTGVHKAIYEEGIEAGIKMLPELLKDVMGLLEQAAEKSEGANITTKLN